MHVVTAGLLYRSRYDTYCGYEGGTSLRGLFHSENIEVRRIESQVASHKNLINRWKSYSSEKNKTFINNKYIYIYMFLLYLIMNFRIL